MKRIKIQEIRTTDKLNSKAFIADKVREMQEAVGLRCTWAVPDDIVPCEPKGMEA